jgi:putative membrane protein
MKNLLTRWLAAILALLVITQTKLIPGIYSKDLTALILTTVVMGFANAFIRPIIMFFAWPINCLTFGLLGFLINAFLFYVAGNVVPGFVVKDYLSALLGSLVMGFLAGLFNYLLKDKEGER